MGRSVDPICEVVHDVNDVIDVDVLLAGSERPSPAGRDGRGSPRVTSSVLTAGAGDTSVVGSPTAHQLRSIVLELVDAADQAQPPQVRR